MLPSFWRNWFGKKVRSRNNGKAPASRRLSFEALEARLALAVHTWTGAVSTLWSNPQNWLEGSTPYGDASAVLLFPASGVTNFTSVDDLAGSGATPIDSITFNGDGFTLSASANNSISLADNGGGITDNLTSGNLNTLNLDIVLANNQQIDVSTGESLVFQGSISGSWGLTVGGPGKVFFKGSTANTYQGGTLVTDDATLDLDKSANVIAVPGGLVLGQTITARGFVFNNSGQLIVESDQQLADNASVTMINGSDLELGGSGQNISQTIGSLSMVGGHVTGAGTLILNGDVTATGLISANVSLGGSRRNFTVTSGDLVISGVISDGGGPMNFTGLTKEGSGLMVLSGANTYQRDTIIKGGTLEVDGSLSSTAQVTVNAGAVLRGSGSIGPLTAAAGSTVDPGPNSLTVSYGATLNPNSFLVFHLDSATPGAGYNQLLGNPVSLGGCTLSLSLGYTPTPGDSYTLIISGGINGTFNGLPMGSTLDVNGQPFSINVHGNDLVLTYVGYSDPNQRFVAAIYPDLLNRPVDLSGLAYWSALLDQGLASRAQVVGDIESSFEYRVQVVQAGYLKFLGRSADPGGLAAFVAALGNGMTDQQFDLALLSSGEYFNDAATRFPTNSGGNDAFVQALYKEVLGRAPDSAGEASWDQALNSKGVSRLTVASDFLFSMESLSDQVQGFYQQFLKRPADPGGLAGFSSQLASGVTEEQVIAEIVSSSEYYNRLTG